MVRCLDTFGGKVDMVMMRIVDVIYSVPDIIIIILLSSVLQTVFKNNKDLANNAFVSTLGTSMLSIFIVFALLYWVGMARLVRGQVLSLKQQEYVLASRSIGAKPSFIIKKHLIPNSMSVIIIAAGLQIPSAIFTESFLSFIGLGVSAPMPSLGSLASSSYQNVSLYPYLLLFPALAICLIVLCFNLLVMGFVMLSIRRCRGNFMEQKQQEHLLVVNDLHTSFNVPAGEVRSVSGISFSLDKGKILGIVGESGSGKSVTAASIMQILVSPGRIKSGSVVFEGEELSRDER
jgi:ABC-type dipeptide/oligopeptide/nickel transport system permease subunit